MTGSSGRWAAILLLAASLTACPTLAAADDAQAKLLQDLNKADSEEDAKALLGPFFDKIKTIKPEIVEKIILKQWWSLARELVIKGHDQGADLSFAVRKAVKAVKDEADELQRTLNPKYGQAQQVAPAFQWAQNDTSIFLTIKYTVRWNAPGALEVTEPSVNMSGNTFNFTGLGKHSNNKYKYSLSLNMFDLINGEQSLWSVGSVGKLSVTLRKKWARKWPRFLANKKLKIGNMHLWSERQETLDDALSGMSTVSYSPVTCAATDKLYCLATDTCKKPDGCAQCPGKTTPKADENICTGIPSEKAGLSFRDSDMTEGKIGGDIKITKARNDFDIDFYDVYWGKDDKTKLGGDSMMYYSTAEKIASAASTGTDLEVKLSQQWIPKGATHLLVFSRNAHGEYPSPGGLMIQDAVLPEGKPTSLSFEDDDGDKGEVSGTITIGKADNDKHLDEYQLYWGKSATRKISGSSSSMSIVRKDGDKNPTHKLSKNTKIPDGATHLLVCTKNKWGENPTFVAFKFVDNAKPCTHRADEDCAAAVTASPDADADAQQVHTMISINRAPFEEKLTHYSVYWGRQGCDGKSGQSGAKNGHIKDIPLTEMAEFELPADTPIPAHTTHVLVFTKNKFGESDHCVSTEFKDKAGSAEL